MADFLSPAEPGRAKIAAKGDAPMPIRKILLPLSSKAGAEAALELSCTVAQRWQAHVLALHVRIDARDVAPLAGEGLSGAMIEEMMAATEREANERTHALREIFGRIVAKMGIPTTEPAPGQRLASAHFAVVVGREEEITAQQARLADLTLVPSPAADGEGASSDALHAVLFDSGRPVLIAPLTPPASIGERICVAWNGTAESAAAVYAALPWLKAAKRVRILSAQEYQRRGPEAPELAAYLALHGVTAELATFRPIDREVGAGLLQAAREAEADLLVMGAYSHSRLRQLILGGVTRHVLEHADLSVLMNR
jgi:nucleotide-binding universal stress UspA family protein